MSRPRPPIAVHVDLDGVQQIFRAHGRTYRGPGDSIFTSGMEAMLGLFESERIRATLFVIAEDVRDPAKRVLLEAAVRAGHELASHTITHPNLLRLSSSQKRHELTDSKAMIEDATGVAVRGFRAPGYTIDAEALRMLTAAGYAFDSSVFPTGPFAERLGMPARALQRPQKLEAFGGVIELPLPGPAPRSIPLGPSLALTVGAAPFYWAMRRAAARGHASVLLFHLIDFAAPLDPAHRENLWLSIFTLSTRSQASKLAACRRMLRFTSRHFVLSSTDEILAQVRAAAPRPVHA